MICVVCSPQDTHALWLATRLRARGRQVELVLPEELLIGSSLQLRVTTEGSESGLRLARGITLDHQCTGVINRLNEVPSLRSESGRPADSAYLEEEWRAAIVAWLAGLACPVLNRPTGVSLCGTMFGDAHWRYLATQVGLAVRPWSAGSAAEAVESEGHEQPARVFVAGKQVIDPLDILSVEARAGVAALAATAQLQLCCAEFDRSIEAPRLIRLNPLVPFAAGGDPLVTAIEGALSLS